VNDTSHNVVDRIDGATIATGLPHDEALRVCEGLEPSMLREDGWRYVIEPVSE